MLVSNVLNTWSLKGREANDAKFLVHLTAIKSSLAAVSYTVSVLVVGATGPGAGPPMATASPPTETGDRPASEEHSGGDWGDGVCGEGSVGPGESSN